jgi:hypothetical protein
MVKSAKVVLAVLFVLCLADMPYGYYQLVRFLGMLGFAFLAFDEHENNNQGMFIFWLLSALLINPFIKVALGRTLWNIVDVIWAILLIISALKTTDSNNK